ncbi:MAG: hypothetical protein GX878_09840 [Firmicutes bacterium]|nr:hypothetical protein [Bacillota bacterium]
MFLSGEAINGTEADGIGLADHYVPVEQLEAVVITFTEKLLSSRLWDVQDQKGDEPKKRCWFEAGLKTEQEAPGFLTGTGDFQEGIVIFMEKRELRWKGR